MNLVTWQHFDCDLNMLRMRGKVAKAFLNEVHGPQLNMNNRLGDVAISTQETLCIVYESVPCVPYVPYMPYVPQRYYEKDSGCCVIQ